MMPMHLSFLLEKPRTKARDDDCPIMHSMSTRQIPRRRFDNHGNDGDEAKARAEKRGGAPNDEAASFFVIDNTPAPHPL